MASIHREIHVDCDPDEAWDALRDWANLHVRLVPGFVTQTEIDGDDRIVTFFNGQSARERFIDSDDERRRLVWSIRSAPYTHHNGVAQVHDDGNGATLFTWTADLLPDALAEPTAPMMERGLQVLAEKLRKRT